MKWGKVSGANGYIVYRSTTKNGTYKKIKSIKGNGKTSYTDSKLNDDKTYYYKVKAYKTIKKKNYYSNFSIAKGKKTLNKNDTTGMTSENLEAQIEYIDRFLELDKNDQIVDGNADKDIIINTIYEEALSGVKDGAIISATKEENGVVMQFSTGIWYVYQPEQGGIDATGNEANVSIVTLQPYQSTYSVRDQRESLEATDYAASKITQKLSNYNFNKNYDNSGVTLDVIKNLSSNQVVLCHTHGFYSNSIGPMIWLGEKVSRSQLLNGGKYEADYLAGRIVITNDYRVGFTSGFISKYCGNLSNSFIYLGACESGKDSRLAQSFLNKGAKAVIANSETIYRGYNCDMMEDIIDGLLTEDKTTHKYYTLEKALSYAKQENGNNDYEWYPNNDHAPSTPVIFGDKNYRLSEKSSIIEVTSVSLSPSSASVNIGNTLSLTATVSPSNATNKTVTWSSSNTSIATVSNGTVTGKAAGTTTITAKTSNGKTATCSVTVMNPVIAATGISLNQSSISIETGKTYTLTATVTPSNATDKTVTWSSSNTSVATVSNGTVTGKTAGAATITAKTSNGKTATCSITVTNSAIAVTGVSLNQSSITIETGKTYTLTATVTPSDATDKTVTWSSSNTSVATVSSGTVTGKSAGTATITAKTNNGKTATCSVTVKNPIIAVTGISLSQSSITIETGKTYSLTATVTPSNATDKTVTWSSSNTSVATVSNGTITGKSAGTASITVKTSNGKTATCGVTVNNPIVEATGISLNASSTNIDIGVQLLLTATVSPSNATNKTVTWSSNNASVATVNNGTIIGKAAGTATITAKTNNGKTASCVVHVLSITESTLDAALVYKADGKFYNICSIGNSSFASVSNKADLYIKVKLNSDKYLGSKFTMYWTENDSGCAPFSYVADDKSLSTVTSGYCYYPISKAVYYITGKRKIYFEIIGSDNKTIKSGHKDYNWNDNSPHAFRVNFTS